MMIRVAALAAVLATAAAVPAVKIGLVTFDGATGTTSKWTPENDVRSPSLSHRPLSLSHAAVP